MDNTDGVISQKNNNNIVRVIWMHYALSMMLEKQKIYTIEIDPQVTSRIRACYGLDEKFDTKFITSITIQKIQLMIELLNFGYKDYDLISNITGFDQYFIEIEASGFMLFYKMVKPYFPSDYFKSPKNAEKIFSFYTLIMAGTNILKAFDQIEADEQFRDAITESYKNRE